MHRSPTRCPAALTSVTWDCVAAGGANCDDASGTGDIATTVDLPVGDSVTFTVDAIVDPAATGAMTNVAEVAAPSGVTDTDLSDNSASDLNPLVPVADLSIIKNDGALTSIPGETDHLHDLREQLRSVVGDRRAGHRHDARCADRRRLDLRRPQSVRSAPMAAGRETSRRPSTSRPVVRRRSPSTPRSLPRRPARWPTPPRSTCPPASPIPTTADRSCDRHEHARADGRPVDHEDRRSDRRRSARQPSPTRSS